MALYDLQRRPKSPISAQGVQVRRRRFMPQCSKFLRFSG
jgi:hypothetical protein